MRATNPGMEKRFGKELTVVLDEDHGYRQFVWFPCMSLSQLVEWWTNQPEVTRYIGLENPYTLPGDIYPVETEEQDHLWASGFDRDDCCKAWLGTDSDSCLVTTNGELVIDQGFPVEFLDAQRQRVSRYLS